MTNAKEWGRAQTQRVADEVRRRRGSLTVQALADRTSELGYPISRSRLSDIERGDRGALLGVAELIVLGRALNVPPLQLLYPGVPGEVIDVLPGTPTLSIAAAHWFSGEQPMQYLLPDPDGRLGLTCWANDLQAHDEGAKQIHLAREEFRLRREIRGTQRTRDRMIFELSKPREERQLFAQLDDERLESQINYLDENMESKEVALRLVRQSLRDIGATPVGDLDNGDNLQ